MTEYTTCEADFQKHRKSSEMSEWHIANEWRKLKGQNIGSGAVQTTMTADIPVVLMEVK